MTINQPEYVFAIDLVMEEHSVTNPILISEHIKLDLDMEVSIFQIMDYLEINNENWILESNKIKYYEKQY
jgi:hypothetical protein